MSDTDASGAETKAAAIENTPSTTRDPNLPASTFGNTRGSGLARGKRAVSPPPQAEAATSDAAYQPTAVSIISPPTEYKNPFAPPTPPSSPEAESPPSESVPPAAEAPASDNGAVAPATEETPSTEEPIEATSKPELKILPPEEPKRVEHSWESHSFREVAERRSPGAAEEVRSDFRPRRERRREDRPVFRPERPRRDDRPSDLRPDAGRRERRDTRQPVSADENAKSGGLFGWVKKIFAGSTPAAEAPAAPSGERREFNGGHRRRRRHRGGRGRHFHGEQRGSGEGRSNGQYGNEARSRDGGQHGGQRRRRRRHRSGGGGYRGGPRSEGGPPAGS